MSINTPGKFDRKIVLPLVATAMVACAPAKAVNDTAADTAAAVQGAVSGALLGGEAVDGGSDKKEPRPRFDEFEQDVLRQNNITIEQANAYDRTFGAINIVRLVTVLHIASPEVANEYVRKDKRFHGVDVAGLDEAGETTKGLIELNVSPDEAASYPRNYMGGEVVAMCANGVSRKEAEEFAKTFPEIRVNELLMFKKAGYSPRKVKEYPEQFSLYECAKFAEGGIDPAQVKSALQKWEATGMYGANADYADVMAVINGGPFDSQE